MVAVLKPIEQTPLQKPAYTGYWLVRQNRRDDWVELNAPQLARWYFQCGATLDDLTAESLDTFADAQFDMERAKFEEMKADGKYDDCKSSPEDL